MSPAHLSESGVPVPVQVGTVAAEGRTTVIVMRDGTPVGIIGLADEVRDGPRTALVELERSGITTVMLTGDNEAAAAATAGRLGVRRYSRASPRRERST